MARHLSTRALPLFVWASCLDEATRPNEGHWAFIGDNVAFLGHLVAWQFVDGDVVFACTSGQSKQEVHDLLSASQNNPRPKSLPEPSVCLRRLDNLAPVGLQIHGEERFLPDPAPKPAPKPGALWIAAGHPPTHEQPAAKSTGKRSLLPEGAQPAPKEGKRAKPLAPPPGQR